MNVLTQLAILLLICFVGEGVALLLPIAFPSSVISMILLFLLLLTGALKLRQIEDAADFLTKNMAFFFIPAGVEILENYNPTVITFAVTAGTVHLCLAVQRRLGGGARA